MWTKGLSRRAPPAWIAWARKFLPLPDSPRRRMLTSWSTTFSSVSTSARMAASPVRTALRSFFAADIARRLAGELGGDVRRVAPQPLQPVKPARLLGEDVDDEVAEVDQDPAARRRPLDEERLHALVGAHLLHDAVGDRMRLPLVRGGAEDEVVGDRRQLADLEDVEVEGLLVERRGHGRLNSMMDGGVHAVPSLYKP